MRGLQAQMSIGKMDQLIHFRLNTTSRDGYGGAIIEEDATAIVYYRAHIREIAAKEAPMDTPQERVIKTIEVEMRSLGASNPTQSHSLVWGDTSYDINDITFTQRQRFMLIKARSFSPSNL